MKRTSFLFLAACTYCWISEEEPCCHRYANNWHRQILKLDHSSQNSDGEIIKMTHKHCVSCFLEIPFQLFPKTPFRFEPQANLCGCLVNDFTSETIFVEYIPWLFIVPLLKEFDKLSLDVI